MGTEYLVYHLLETALVKSFLGKQHEQSSPNIAVNPVIKTTCLEVEKTRAATINLLVVNY